MSGSRIIGEMLAEIRRSKVEHESDVVQRYIPALVCESVGHLNQPRILLGRFARRPWRCPRCSRWLVTKKTGDSAGAWWEWDDITGEVL